MENARVVREWTLQPYRTGRQQWLSLHGRTEGGDIRTSKIRRCRITQEGTFVETLNTVYRLQGAPLSLWLDHVGEWGEPARKQVFGPCGALLDQLGARWLKVPTKGLTADHLFWKVTEQGSGWVGHANETHACLVRFHDTVPCGTAGQAKLLALRGLRARINQEKGKPR